MSESRFSDDMLRPFWTDKCPVYPSGETLFVLKYNLCIYAESNPGFLNTRLPLSENGEKVCYVTMRDAPRLTDIYSNQYKGLTGLLNRL